MRYFETRRYARELRRSQTMAEKYFWEKVRSCKLYGLKFNRQYIIEYLEYMNNKFFYIADFHNFQHKIIIEIDGEIHKSQKEYDDIRQKNIEALGYKVLRFSNEEVFSDWEIIKETIFKTAFIDK